MGGYIAHHQVYTIFQGLPRQVPPDHMCHPWPISRVGPRAQNFALKSQISLPNKSLRTLWTFFPLRPIMGHGGGLRSAGKKNRRKIEVKLRSCAPESVAFFLRTLFFLFFGGTPLQKLCIWPLLKKNFFGGTLYSDLWFGRTQHHKMCSGLLLIQWFSLGFLLIFFRRNSASQNVRLSSADLGFFWRKSINLVMHDYPWFPAACSFPNVNFNLY